VAPDYPGAQGVIYDTALRGVHHQTLLRNLGCLSINKVVAAERPRLPPALPPTQRRRVHQLGPRRHLWLRRAHSVGHARQHLNLLTYALTVNSLALWRQHARRGDPPLPLAA
jgi:hypothetical protein